MLVDANGWVSDAGRAGTAGVPPVLFSTAVDDDEMDDAGAGGAGTVNELFVPLFATTPARSQGFGGDGIDVVGSRFRWSRVHHQRINKGRIHVNYILPIFGISFTP